MQKEELEKLIEENLSIGQIAKKLNTTKAKIRWQLKIHNLKTQYVKFGNYPYKNYCCKYCGENKKENFYGHRKNHCIKCRSKINNNIKYIIKKEFVDYKGGKCSKCGYDKCLAVFDFHHIDPTKKDFNMSRISNIATSKKEKIKIELDKCELLCANCHRELHYNLMEEKLR